MVNRPVPGVACNVLFELLFMVFLIRAQTQRDMFPEFFLAGLPLRSNPFRLRLEATMNDGVPRKTTLSQANCFPPMSLERFPEPTVEHRR